MRTASILMIVTVAAAGCGKKADDPNKQPAGSAKETPPKTPDKPATGSAKPAGSATASGSAAPTAGGVHPLLATLGFPNTALGAAVGQWAFAPNDARLKSAVEGAKHELGVLGYGVVEIKSVGETESKVSSGSEFSVPNAFIVPIPKGQTVEPGDLVVASRYGNSLDRAIVTAGGATPKANFMNTMPYGKPNEAPLKPDQFFKLDGSELQPGSAVAHPSLIGGNGWDLGIVIRVAGDAVLVHGHMGAMKVWKKSDLRALPVKLDSKPGDSVYAIWDSVHFMEGKVEKVDPKLGLFTLRFPSPFDKDPKMAPFGSVAPAVFK
jgi:hypothetical protein